MIFGRRAIVNLNSRFSILVISKIINLGDIAGDDTGNRLLVRDASETKPARAELVKTLLNTNAATDEGQDFLAK